MSKTTESTIIRALKADIEPEKILKMQELKDQAEKARQEKLQIEASKPFVVKIKEITESFIIEHWIRFLLFLSATAGTTFAAFHNSEFLSIF